MCCPCPQRSSRYIRNQVFVRQTLRRIVCIGCALNRAIRKGVFLVSGPLWRRCFAGHQTRPSRVRQGHYPVHGIRRRLICILQSHCRPRIWKGNFPMICRKFQIRNCYSGCHNSQRNYNMKVQLPHPGPPRFPAQVMCIRGRCISCCDGTRPFCCPKRLWNPMRTL